MIFFYWIGWLLTLLAICGAAYTLLAAYLAGRFAHTPAATAARLPAMTVLKPLHGDEPALEANLETFFTQDYPAPLQLVFGVSRADDPALAVVDRLRALHPDVETAVVTDARRHGANAKVSNLVNMRQAARHEVYVLSDSDIAVPSDYLRRLAAGLEREEVGAITCPYTGWGAAGFASCLCAMGIDYQFLPNAIAGVSLGLVTPCFGSTIALKRAVLDEIGGFEAFAAKLADDYEIGRAVRAAGRSVVVDPMIVRHACSEASMGDWLAHELRWARTTRVLAPAGHAGSVVTFAIPLGALGAILSSFTLFSLASTLVARAVLKWRIDRLFGCNGGPLWLLPMRDVASFCVFLVSLWGGAVEWRGERLHVTQSDALSNR
jgi:ceramide glucosyltransferase